MRRIVLFFLNNIIINQILIVLGKDQLIRKYQNNWTRVKLNTTKTLQENVGFSHTAIVDEAIARIHSYLKDVELKYLNESSHVLDVGCGVGLYLKDFNSKHLYGTDLNEDFLLECKRLVPISQTFLGDYLKINFDRNRFNLIYSISVIEYIPPSQINEFFNKIHTELQVNGIVVIQYPHALNWRDKWYSDLSYISYLPLRIERAIKGRFEIILHEHSYDKRKIRDIDNKNYSTNSGKNFCNGMILVARKTGDDI